MLFNPEKVDQAKFAVALDYRLNISQGDVEATPVKVSEAVSSGVIPNGLIGYYLYLIQSFYENAGIQTADIRLRKLGDKEKAFYSAVAFDLEVKTSVGWLELVACNYRSDYDFRQHTEVSKSDYTVEDDGKKVLPHVFELSMGIDRSLYVLLEKAYRVDETRTYLALKPSIAPVQVGVFPLVSKDGLPEKAREIYDMLRIDMDATYDEGGSIGRRYAALGRGWRPVLRDDRQGYPRRGEDGHGQGEGLEAPGEGQGGRPLWLAEGAPGLEKERQRQRCDGPDGRRQQVHYVVLYGDEAGLVNGRLPTVD